MPEGSSSTVTGSAAIDKATLGQAIDAALLIVIGLLGVAVVIAFVGVTNTITLSVLERTRENALLRALGLSRSQLRWMLILETLMITGVTVLLGTILGTVYGAAAAFSGLGSSDSVTVTIPFQQIILLIGLTLVTGLCASLIPARKATKLSPIAGIQSE